jgi:hypothetical protein
MDLGHSGLTEHLIGSRSRGERRIGDCELLLQSQFPTFDSAVSFQRAGHSGGSTRSAPACLLPRGQEPPG